jgi:4-hydroxyphenylpyruvate dioxygenase
MTRYGFEAAGYRGLETEHRDYVSHVIRQANIFWVFKSPLNPDEREMNGHLARHGDGVRDVAFTVDDARGIFNVRSELMACVYRRR